MKHATYSGTRNLYADMLTAAKSLIANSGVTDVWLLIEDDVFPYELPPIVDWHILNMSNQQWFGFGCPNLKTEFTYMAMIRACYAEIFADLDRILSLDCDTVCISNVDWLWSMELHGNWIAAANEHLGTYKPYGSDYYNVGVALYDLAQMRTDNATEQLVHLINTKKLWCVEQDAFNYFHKVEPMPGRFNESAVTGYSDNPAIVHYASFGTNWHAKNKVPRKEYYRLFNEMDWSQVARLHDGKSSDSRTDV
jgi:lipopolysaccharide biosynthesis glycosyltransferase